jgi:hypothetical protein
MSFGGNIFLSSPSLPILGICIYSRVMDGMRVELVLCRESLANQQTPNTSHIFQDCAEMRLKLRQDLFHPHPFQFIIH